MVTIYTNDGEYLTQGLQSRLVCDEARRAAEELAKERSEPVILEDREGEYTPYIRVHPNGSYESLEDFGGE